MNNNYVKKLKILIYRILLNKFYNDYNKKLKHMSKEMNNNDSPTKLKKFIIK